MSNGTDQNTGLGMAELVAINEAIVSGVTTVSYNGKSVTYRSLDELLRLRTIIMSALGLTPRASGTILAAHDRGYPGPWYGTVEIGEE